MERKTIIVIYSADFKVGGHPVEPFGVFSGNFLWRLKVERIEIFWLFAADIRGGTRVKPFLG